MSGTAPALGFSEDGGIITVRMTREDWESLLMCFGYGLALARDPHQSDLLFYHWTGVLNRLNAGNPNFTPYEIPTAEEQKRGKK